MAAITPTAASEYIAKSRNDLLVSEIEPLEQQLEAAYETFEQEHELAEAVDEATAPKEIPPVYRRSRPSALGLDPEAVHDERQELLAEIRERLQYGDGEVIEIE